jgi:aminoglycoside 6'-N-acetyltransferase I
MKTTNDIRIRSIDSSSLLSDCAAILVDAYNGEPWNDEWTHAKALEKLMCFYQSPKFMGWMAYEGDELLGCCVGNIEPYYTGDYFYLKEMFVSGSSQRTGVGSRLMEVINQDLKTMGIEMVILFTSNEGFPFQFWKHHGFGEIPGMRMMHLGGE